MEQKKEDCQSCKKGFSVSQKYMIVSSSYILLSSIYGTYIIITELIDLIF